MYKILKKYSTRNISLVFVLFNLIIRIPSLNNDIAPYFFVCDEGIYFGETYHMLVKQSYVQKSFRAGFANIFPVLVPFKIFTLIFTEGYINPEVLLLAGRFVLPVFLSSFSLFFIDLSLKELNSKIKNSERVLYLSIITFSSYFFSQSRLWYPDHYQIFFTTIIIFLLLRINNQKKLNSNLYFLILSLICLVGVKYSGAILTMLILPILIYLFVNSLEYKNSNNVLLLATQYGLFSLFFASLFNFSIFLNFEKFIYDYNANLSTYGPSTLSFQGFNYYFIFLFLVPFSFFSLPFIIIAIYKLIDKREYFLIYLLLIVPTLICVFLGSFGVLVNRNINFLIPFSLLLLSIGINKNLYTQKKNYTYLLIILILFFQIGTFSNTLVDDFKVDSRVEAELWIKENIADSNLIEFGVNEFCTGESPVQQYAKITYDHDFKKNFDYYLINDYWDSLATRTLPQKNILFQANHKNTHFYYLNYRNLINENIFNFEKNYVTPLNYKVIKVFEGNGPTMILYGKINN